MTACRAALIATRAQRDALLHEQYGHGTLEVDRCPLCGSMRLSSYQRHDTDAVTIRDMRSPEECARCEEIMRRAPEIFRWIVGVSATARMFALTLEDDKP